MSKKKNSKVPFVGIFLAFLIIIGIGIVCFFFWHESISFVKQKIQTPVTVEFKWLNNAQFTGFYVADAKHWYDRNGLNVTFIERDFSKTYVSDRVASGDVTFGVTNSFDVIEAINNGEPIVAIAAIYQNSPSSIAVLTDSNITSLKDLQGKKFGVTSLNPEVKLLSQYLLLSQNINPETVTYVNIGDNQVDALANGEVDAVGIYRTRGAYELTKKEQPYTLFLPESYGLSTYNDVIITSTDMIENHPDVVKRFVQVTMKGWAWTLQNEDEAITLSQQYFNPEYNNIWQSRYILMESIPLIKPSTDTAIGEMDDSKWQKQIDAMYKYGLIAQPLKAGQVFTNRFIQ